MNNPLFWTDPYGLEPVLVVNRPGFVNDVWERPPGHPPISLSFTYGYYVQWRGMSCTAAAILNYWVTYDIPVPVRYRSSDEAAERYVCDELARVSGENPADWDWDSEGVNYFGHVVTVAGHGARHVLTAPTADDIIRYVGQGRAVIIAFDSDVLGPSLNPDGSVDPHVAFHVITIVPTPVGLLDSGSIDPAATITVLDGTNGPVVYTPDGFRKMFKATFVYKPDPVTGAGRTLVDEHLVGPPRKPKKKGD